MAGHAAIYAQKSSAPRRRLTLEKRLLALLKALANLTKVRVDLFADEQLLARGPLLRPDKIPL